jgi:hypothetical protein
LQNFGCCGVYIASDLSVFVGLPAIFPEESNREFWETKQGRF